jgi:Flp pilus assembly pilin Flp
MKLTQGTLLSRSERRLTPWRNLFRRLLHDEKGAVSVETMLIIAAIALPILIFIIKFGWPRIRDFFDRGMDNLEGEATNAGTTGT